MSNDFIRHEDGYNVYELDCPCGTVGEVGVPDRSTKVFRHDCGTMYVQKMVSGRSIYEKPRLVTVARD